MKPLVKEIVVIAFKIIDKIVKFSKILKYWNPLQKTNYFKSYTKLNLMLSPLQSSNAYDAVFRMK